MEALTLKWMRRLQIAVVCLVLAGVAGLGLAFAWTIVSQAEMATTLPALPAKPHLAAAVKRPVRYAIKLPPPGTAGGETRLLGPYATWSDAESDLVLLQHVLGYEAMTVETYPAPVQPTAPVPTR